MGVRVVTIHYTEGQRHETTHQYDKADSWNTAKDGYVEVVEDSGTDDARVIAVLQDWIKIEAVDNIDEDEDDD